MAAETELYFFCKPSEVRPVALPVEFLTVQEFLADEQACQSLWELASSQFRTRGKFFSIWQTVRNVALHRNADGQVDGLLLVTCPVNWQIDYVMVDESMRHRGVAVALVHATLNQALARKVPYVMLTSKPNLRSLYEGQCGFRVVATPEPVAEVSGSATQPSWPVTPSLIPGGCDACI